MLDYNNNEYAAFKEEEKQKAIKKIESLKTDKKITFNEFYTILEAYNNGFYNSVRVKKVINNKNYYAIIFYLSSKIDDEVKTLLQKFTNIQLLYSTSEYAPELKTNCICIYDNSIKNIDDINKYKFVNIKQY